MFRVAASARGFLRAPTTPADTTAMSYYADYSQIGSTSGTVLASVDYKFLQLAIANAGQLQEAYAVKQTEIERAHKAANVCGLDFLRPGNRKATPGASPTYGIEKKSSPQ